MATLVYRHLNFVIRFRKDKLSKSTINYLIAQLYLKKIRYVIGASLTVQNAQFEMKSEAKDSKEMLNLKV